jgi:hypothetical protein
VHRAVHHYQTTQKALASASRKQHMPYPYTRRRSRNRARGNPNQPFSASPAIVITAVHGTSKTTLTFNQSMDTTLVQIPVGLTVAGVAPTGVTWTSPTVAELVTATSTAGDSYSVPASTTWRTIAGAPIAAQAGVLT